MVRSQKWRHPEGIAAVRHQDWQSVSNDELKLRHLVGEATAARLIQNALLSNPGKSRSWCAEKALYEYQRDRR
ncbi:MAG: hypothetical protein AAFY11_02560 [Cyanobacteria bacterium J06641_5]